MRIELCGIFGTYNLNNLFKSIQLRFHEGTQWEIQQLAKGIITIKNLWPRAMRAYMEHTGNNEK